MKTIDETVFIDGVQWGAPFTFQAPPNHGGDVFSKSFLGHLPSTTTCEAESDPCVFVVGKPAVTPGENTVLFYTGWGHGVDEPDGSYVFKYTIHGTFNGTEVAVTATSPTITMTG